MRKYLLGKLFFIPIFLLSTVAKSQTLPELGTTKRFVVFSSVGLITNSGTSYYTGDVGNNAGITNGFGNFDGNMQTANAVSQQAADDLDDLVIELNGLTCNTTLLTMTATNTRFMSGVTCVTLGSTLSDSIILDAQFNPNALFVFNINGSLTFSPNARVYLVNGAQACRVFWNVSGLVNVGLNSIIKGNIIGSNIALNAITLNNDVEIEGRVLATSGAITLTSIKAALPLGCGLPVLTGPVSPNLRSASCYALFSSAGNLSNTGTTAVQGRIGTDLGTVTGYQAANISDGIFTQNANTAQAKIDIDLAYNYINPLVHDVDITFPLLFGNGMSISPRVYRLNSNTLLSDTLFIDAQGIANSTFIIKVNGSFTQAANAKVVLINGAKSCNIFWLVSGTVTINANSKFVGNLISNDDLAINTNSIIDGRLFTRSGDASTNSVTAAIATGCGGCPFNPSNNAPNAVNDNVTIPEDAPSTAINVLNNDNDPDGDALSVSIIKGAGKGTATTNGTTVSYKPDANFNGKDTIFYRVCDNKTPSLCDSAFIFITIPNVGDKPVAVDDTVYAKPQVPVQVNIVANDYHPDGFPVTVGFYKLPKHGNATTNSVNVTYVADSGYFGTDTLYYRVYDNQIVSQADSAIVIFFVSDLPPEIAPVANPNSVILCQNSDSTFIYVQNNDYDANGDALTTSIASSPLHGTATVINGSAIAYIPQQDYVGYDTIMYAVCDSQFCDTSFIYIQVQPSPNVSAGPDRSIMFGDSVIIGSSTSASTSYLWEPRDYLSDPFISNPFASPIRTITYLLKVTETTSGCSNTDEVIVTVTGDGFYNALSPNDDGVNDFWKIPALNIHTKNYVTIINRFGSEVWKGTDYDNNNIKFEGRNMNGDPLPDGTYFFIINFNNTRKEGWVIIKR